MFEQFKNSSKGPLLLSIFPPYQTGFYLVLQCSNGITDQSTVLSGLRALFSEMRTWGFLLKQYECKCSWHVHKDMGS